MFSRVFALHFLIRRDMAAVSRHASPTPRYERCHADFTPSQSSRVSVSSSIPNAPPPEHAWLGRETSRPGIEDVLEFGVGIREQILLRVVLEEGKACFSGIRASVDLEIIEIFLFYGWEDWNWKSGIRRISPPIKLANREWFHYAYDELTIYSDRIDCLIV